MLLGPSLAVSAILFSLGVAGVLLRRNAIIIFMCIELMLNAVNLSFIAFSQYLGNLDGQIFVFFVMTVAAVVTWFIQYFILVPLGIEYLQTIAFILVIASLVQLVEMAVQKSSPVLYQSLGIFLPLITTNCAVLGLAVLNIQKGYSFLESIIFAIGAALGFTLAMVLFAGLRERIDLAPVPRSFRGTAIALITAGLLSLAFMGFTGLVKG